MQYTLRGVPRSVDEAPSANRQLRTQGTAIPTNDL
jgi:hypothetical protein